MRVIERRPASRCSICHGDLGAEARRCCGCGTTLHVDCDDEVGCPTLGCATRGASVVVAPRARSRWAEVGVAAGVLAALGLLLLSAVPRVPHHGRSRGVVRSNFQQIASASAMFEADHRRFPRRLQELTERGADGAGPYVHAPLVDPWGRAYHFLPGARGARPVVVTLGADGVVGGEGPDEDVWSDDRWSEDR